jgi:hypothetical protein
MTLLLSFSRYAGVGLLCGAAFSTRHLQHTLNDNAADVAERLEALRVSKASLAAEAAARALAIRQAADAM